jgi:hypothetical protein
MRAGFQIQVESRAARFLPCLFESEDFGMFYAFVSMDAGTDFAIRCIDDHCADCGIRRHESDTRSGEVESSAHILFVGGHAI